MSTDLLHGIALAIMATTQAVQVYLMHRAYRRLWQLEGDVARLLVKQQEDRERT